MVAFVATGGYALKTYDRFAKIRRGQGRALARGHAAHRPAIPHECRHHRRGRRCSRCGSAARGTRRPASAAAPVRGGRVLGEVEEYFAETLVAGRHLRVRRRGAALRGASWRTTSSPRAPRPARTPRCPSYAGGKFPLSTFLAERVRAMLADPARVDAACRAAWPNGWRRSAASPCCRGATNCWSRPSRAAGRHYLVAYPFEGRLAHQTLGMLLTRRLERARLRPLGFVATDYGIAVLGPVAISAPRFAQGALSLAELFSQDMLGDDLEEWLAESALMKRTFRHCAIIAGLIERRFPGQEKTRPAGDDVDRPRLRRAAPARAGPHPAQGDARRCGDGAARPEAPRGHAVAHQGANRAQAAGARLSARRSR